VISRELENVNDRFIRGLIAGLLAGIVMDTLDLTGQDI
jgi:hypothetical protein